MKNALLMLVLAPALAFAAAPAPHVKYPGAEIRQKYVLLVETWKANHQGFIRDHPDLFRKHVHDVFLSYVVNPASVRVEIAETTQEQLQQGFFPHIVFEFRDGDFDTGKVKHLFVDMKDVQLDFENLLLWDRIRFVKQGNIQYICEITEDDLNNAIFKADKKKMPLRNPRIELREGTMKLSGGYKHALGTTNVRLEGSMKLVEGTKIHFQPTSLKLSILPIPGFVYRQIFEKVNPIADLAKLKFDATPDLITTRQDRLYVLTKGMMDQIGK